jgi:hypothetical protein
VVSIVARLVQRGLIRLVDRVHMSNVYVCTSLLRRLPSDPRLRKQCVAYCRPSGAASPPLFSAAYHFLCAIDPSKRISEVCLSLPRAGGGAGGVGLGGGRSDTLAAKIDVLRLVRFARVHRFIRRIHHWPIWVGPDAGDGCSLAGGVRRPDPSSLAGGSKSKAGKARSGVSRELSAKILAHCNGRYCYDAIACALGVSVDEVEDECERGPHKDEILVIARMASDEAGADAQPAP